MATKKKMSVVIPVFNRREILRTLRANQQLFEVPQIEVIVVDCKSKGTLVKEILALGIANVRVVVLELQRFNKAVALNIGTFLARGEILFFLDADIILDRNFFAKCLPKVDVQNFVTVKHVVESNPSPHQDGDLDGLSELAYLTEFVNGRTHQRVRVETNRVFFHDNARGGPGLIVVQKKNVLAVSGVNSELVGWGWEDVDLVVRLQMVLKLKKHSAGRVTHLTHSDDVRSFEGSSRSENEMRNFMRCLINYRQHNLKGSYHRDVREWRTKLRVFS